MSADFWFLFQTGFIVAMAMMLLVWVMARMLNNAGIVDVAWSLGFGLIAVVFLLIGTGSPARTQLFTAMVVIWSLRLGLYLWGRVASHHPTEDARYATLRSQFPKSTWLMFFGFFQLQAVLLAVLSFPAAIVASNPRSGIDVLEWCGAALWLVAMLGEAIADIQLDRFRRNPDNKGKTCKVGLWRVSRHPNYFFEWLIWVAFFIFALGSPQGWIAIFCPIVMLIFLFKVTGIPATEEQAVKSRGDEYREYQRTTSVFIPWFPKKS